MYNHVSLNTCAQAHSHSEKNADEHHEEMTAGEFLEIILLIICFGAYLFNWFIHTLAVLYG